MVFIECPCNKPKYILMQKLRLREVLRVKRPWDALYPAALINILISLCLSPCRNHEQAERIQAINIHLEILLVFFP